MAKEPPHAVRDSAPPMRIPPHEAEHNFALRDAQKLIHRELPLYLNAANCEAVALAMGAVRCSVDVVCPGLVSRLLMEILPLLRPTDVSDELCARFVKSLAAALPVGLSPVTPREETFLAEILNALENHIDAGRLALRGPSDGRVGMDKKERTRILSVLNGLLGDQRVTDELTKRLCAFLLIRNARITSTQPVLLLEALAPDADDVSSAALTQVYRAAYNFPRHHNARVRYAMMDFYEWWQYAGCELSPAKRRQWSTARAFLCLLANSRRNNAPATSHTMARLPLDLILLIAANLAPECRQLRRCYQDEHSRWHP